MTVYGHLIQLARADQIHSDPICMHDFPSVGPNDTKTTSKWHSLANFHLDSVHANQSQRLLKEWSDNADFRNFRGQHPWNSHEVTWWNTSPPPTGGELHVHHFDRPVGPALRPVGRDVRNRSCMNPS